MISHSFKFVKTSSNKMMCKYFNNISQWHLIYTFQHTCRTILWDFSHNQAVLHVWIHHWQSSIAGTQQLCQYLCKTKHRVKRKLLTSVLLHFDEYFSFSFRLKKARGWHSVLLQSSSFIIELRAVLFSAIFKIMLSTAASIMIFKLFKSAQKQLTT